MNTRKQTVYFQKSKLLVAPIALIVVVILSIALWTWQQKSEATSTAQEEAPSVKFVYDNAIISGWWTSGNNYPDPSMADSNTPKDAQWPIADISLHQCKSATKCSDPEQDTVGAHCFVSTFYKDDTIEPDRAIADMINKNKGWGTTVTKVASKTLTMSTPDGDKSYVLHQFDYSTSGGKIIKQGNAQGYIPLDSGYIDIRAVCDEASQLDEATPALNAISLVKAS